MKPVQQLPNTQLGLAAFRLEPYMNKAHQDPIATNSGSRKAWSTPVVRKLEAGSAEVHKFNGGPDDSQAKPS